MFPYHVLQNVSLPRVHCTGKSETDAIQRTTTAITMIQGGIKENVMPSIARVSQLWENRDREQREGEEKQLKRRQNVLRLSRNYCKYSEVEIRDFSVFLTMHIYLSHDKLENFTATYKSWKFPR